MHKRSIRALALVLAALLTLPPAASASWALGTEIHTGTVHLAEGVDYTRQHLWSATYADLRTERYLEYTPNDLVQPVVAYGDTILSKNTLSALAQGLEEDGKRVLGGINGDYFVVATGSPLGMVITDGILRSSSSYHYALGFDADGNAFIGQPQVSITATFGGHTLIVADLNKTRSNTGGYVLYTSDYSTTTQHTASGVDVILMPSSEKLGQSVRVDLDVNDVPSSLPEEPDPEADANPGAGTETGTGSNPTAGSATGVPPESTGSPSGDSITDSEDVDPEDLIQDDPSADPPMEEVVDTLVYTDTPIIGGRIACTVVDVLHSSASIEIPEGCLVLSVNDQSNAWLVEQLAALQAGDCVDIDITCADSRWKTAVTAIGGLYKMVTQGVVETGLSTSQDPRTAVGIKADGTVVFYTVDGRQSSYSVGAGMDQAAARLVELGCVEAICLDGGGSTTLGASLPGDDSFSVQNRPSDGSERAVSSALFLVADQAASGPAQTLILSPGDAIMLSGSTLNISAYSVDALGQAVFSYNPNWVFFSLPPNAGSVSNGILTAGPTSGTYPLTAVAGGLTGTAVITVVSSPDQINLYDEATGFPLSSVVLSPGQSLELSAAAVYRNLPLICADENFTWTVSEGLGTIDGDGTLTAGTAYATGSLSVTAGETTTTIPLTVTGHIYTVEDFEGPADHVSTSDTASLTVENRSSYVRFGRQSADLTYLMGESDYAGIGISLPVQAGEHYLSLWVYGDGSGNTLSVTTGKSDGTTEELPLCLLEFNGWTQITVALPEHTCQLLAVNILPTGLPRQGTIWLDQITSSNQYTRDRIIPTVELALTETTLTAALQDDMGETFADGQVSVSMDGVQLPFTLTDNLITAVLPEPDGLAHRVTVTATDASGNIGKASADIAPTAQRELPFADIEGHWAREYITYLYDQKLSTGVAVGEELRFHPADAITRGEFAVIVTRWLGLDAAQYSHVELPFTDADSIPAWAMDSIKAMYALGFMQGSSTDTGTYINFHSSLTRAEGVTLLGRIQAKGHVSAPLMFHDSADIPSWAAEYVSTMVAQGVVNGVGNNMVAPHATLTRGEVAKILYALR